MAKKAPNNKATISAGNFTISPEISDKLNSAALTEKGVALNKACNRERIRSKQAARRENKAARIEHGYKSGTPMTNDHVYALLNNASRIGSVAKPSKRQMLPSNHNKREQGYNGWSREWNQSAHTGVTGTPPKKIPRSDARYQAQPYVPKVATVRK